MCLRMFVALSLFGSVFVSFLVFIDKGIQMGSKSELGTDGTKVSVCVFLCVHEDLLATCLSGCTCKRIIFPFLFPQSSLGQGILIFEKEKATLEIIRSPV